MFITGGRLLDDYGRELVPWYEIPSFVAKCPLFYVYPKNGGVYRYEYDTFHWMPNTLITDLKFPTCMFEMEVKPIKLIHKRFGHIFVFPKYEPRICNEEWKEQEYMQRLEWEQSNDMFYCL